MLSSYVCKNLELDQLSKLTMTYTSEGLEELKQDILTRGQLVPIILRNGKILDGRHRHKVCVDLAIGIECKELGNISDSCALDTIISNMINKTTRTDAAKTEAYLVCKAKGIAKSSMPNKFSRLNSNYVSKLSFIEKVNPEYLNVLLHQNKVTLYNMEFRKIEDYGTINGLWRTLKGNQKLEDKVIEVVAEPIHSKNHTVNVDEYFKNSNAEQEYWDLYNLGKNTGVNLHLNTDLGSKIAALVKSKYL